MLAAECLLTLRRIFGERQAMMEMEAMKENLPPEILSEISEKINVSNVENKDIMPLNVGKDLLKSSTMLKQNPLQNSVTLQAPFPKAVTSPRTPKPSGNRHKGRKKVPSAPLKQLPCKYYKKESKKKTKLPTRRSARLVEKWIKKED